MQLIGAINPELTAVVAIVSVVISGVCGVYVAVTRNRHDQRVDRGEDFSRTIAGFKALIAAQDARIDELEEEVNRVRTQANAARAESRRANEHAAECERDLRQANARIRELERTG